MVTGAEQSQRPARRPALVRVLSNIWFGMTFLTLILLYSCVVSGVPSWRAAFELTESAAYHHWVFLVLVALFTLSLGTATFFRTRWTGVNAGALTTHVGLLLLVCGAAVYFGTKIEGDVLLQTPAVWVRGDGLPRTPVIGRFPAHAGYVWAPAGTDLQMAVVKTEPAGVQPVGTLQLRVALGDETHELTLAADEDWRTIREGLSARLVTYPPETVFYESGAAALVARNRTRGTRHEFPLVGLPQYHPRVPADAQPIHDSAGRVVESWPLTPSHQLLGLRIPTGWLEPWRLPLAVPTNDLPFDVAVLGFLPYVADWRRGGGSDGAPELVPVVADADERRVAGPAILLSIRGRTAGAGWERTTWCPFNPYPELEPRVVEVQDPQTGDLWELIYARPRRPLGAALVGHKLVLKYFPGRRGIESYRSDFMLQEGPTGTPRAAVVQTNETLTVGPWTLYQSSYDADEHWRYTVLGVGNRNGITLMNVGWVLVTLGCIYAFYIKPVLLRRARARAAPAASE